MLQFTKVVVLASALLLALSCAKTKQAGENLVRYSAMMGTWETQCGDEPIFDLASARSYFIFSGEQAKEIKEYYSDGDCKTPALRIDYEGSLFVGKDSAEVKDAKRIRVELTKVYMANFNADLKAKVLEPLNACGYSIWPVGKSREVTKSANDLNCPLGAIPEQKETIVRRDGDTLYFGEWYQGDAISTPVAELDTENGYQKSSRTFEDVPLLEE